MTPDGSVGDGRASGFRRLVARALWSMYVHWSHEGFLGVSYTPVHVFAYTFIKFIIFDDLDKHGDSKISSSSVIESGKKMRTRIVMDEMTIGGP
jgi:hypothetical protein